MGKQILIRNELRRLAESVGPAPTILARIKAVDEDLALVTLEETLASGEMVDVFDVRLRAVSNGKTGVLFVPKVGTYVLAVRIEDEDDWMVIGFDEIEKIVFKAEGAEMVLDSHITIKNANSSIKTVLDGICDALLTIYAPKDIAKITEVKTIISTLFK